MKRCKNISGLIAASLYEPLSAEEQSVLDGHFESCSQCRKTAEELAALVAAIPCNDVAFEGDFRPVIEERIREHSNPVAAFRKHWFAPLCATMAVLIVAVGLWQGGAIGPQVAPSKPKIIAKGLSDSRLASYLEEADTKMASGDFTGALVPLRTAVAGFRGDPLSGEAQLKLAELQFIHLRRYADAYAAYEELRREYFDTFSASSESKLRFELLTEEREHNYAPLYALDAARDSTGDVFVALEELVAKNTGKIVAELAVTSMHELIMREDISSEYTIIEALEIVQARCSNPVAVDQVTWALGNSWRAQDDPDKARSMFESVAESNTLALAQLGRQRLAEIDRSLVDGTGTP